MGNDRSYSWQEKTCLQDFVTGCIRNRPYWGLCDHDTEELMRFFVIVLMVFKHIWIQLKTMDTLLFIIFCNSMKFTLYIAFSWNKFRSFPIKLSVTHALDSRAAWNGMSFISELCHKVLCVMIQSCFIGLTFNKFLLKTWSIFEVGQTILFKVTSLWAVWTEIKKRLCKTHTQIFKYIWNY